MTPDASSLLHQARIRWPYATKHVDPRRVTSLLPPIEETNPGSLLLAKVLTIGKHKELEDHRGLKFAIFPGDYFIAVLGHRYATDQFEAVAHCSGSLGHIVGIGGVSGEVVSKNNRMVDPTIIEWVGRLAGPDGKPLHLSQFHADTPPSPGAKRPTTILSVGASMNSGKTTTAAQMIRSLTGAGKKVCAVKVTGTACRKDPNFLYDAGAAKVIDFVDVGWPSTAGCSLKELLAISAELRAQLLAEHPEFIVIELADGIFQRETDLLLRAPEFHATIDATTFAAPDALACESGVRRLRELNYNVVATAGMVANSRLGIDEAQRATNLRCFDGEAILRGDLLPHLQSKTPSVPAPTSGSLVGSVRSGKSAAPSISRTQPVAATGHGANGSHSSLDWAVLVKQIVSSAPTPTAAVPRGDEYR